MNTIKKTLQIGSAKNRGEASIIIVLIVLLTIAVSAMVITSISIVTLKSSIKLDRSSQAFYAADSGLERGLFDYNWSNGTVCSNFEKIILPNGSFYYLATDDGNANSCPTSDEVWVDQSKPLCVEARGEINSIRRRLFSGKEHDAVTCPNN